MRAAIQSKLASTISQLIAAGKLLQVQQQIQNEEWHLLAQHFAELNRTQAAVI
jgi:uncharacterized protein YajQ (UPF0234 family)